MRSIYKKVSRSAYRKSYKQQSKATYFQQMLIKSDVLDQPKLQQYLLKYCQPQNPQGNSQRNWYDKDRSQQTDQIVVGNYDQSKINNSGNLGKQASNNKYYSEYLALNSNRNINNKVERQRFNIEIQNYRKLMKQSKSIISDMLNQLKEYLLSIQCSLQRSRSLLQKHAKINKVELDAQKQKQANLQAQIVKLTIKLHRQFKARNQFLSLILQNGHYQQNGLLWVLHQMIDISAIDQDNRANLRKECPIIVSQRQLSHIFSEKQTGIILRKEDFPAVMDNRSREYMLDVYQKLKAQKSCQLAKSLQYHSKVKQYLKLNDQPYIFDNESALFPHSSTNLKNQQFKNKQIYSTLMMLQKTSDNLIKRYHIKDMMQSMQLHAQQQQKFNYDTKSIYANTKEALNKWVKGKCKSIIRQSQIINQQYISKPIQTSETSKNAKIKTQQSLLAEQSKKEYSMIQYVESAISQKDVNANKSTANSRIRKQAYSLPLIQQKQRQTPSSLIQLQKSNVIKISQDRYKNNRSSVHVKKQAKKGSLSTSVVSQQNDINDIKVTKQIKGVKSTQQKEQTRIVRLYPKEKQDLALKYMFGIHVHREDIAKNLYQ